MRELLLQIKTASALSRELLAVSAAFESPLARRSALFSRNSSWRKKLSPILL